MIDGRVRVQLATYGAVSVAALVGTISLGLGLHRIWLGMVVGAAITFAQSMLSTGANALNHQHETTIATLNSAMQDWQRNLATEQKWTETLVVERNEARQLVAEMASENVILTDRIRHLEASLSGVREELRQERVERARAAELVTPESLETAMRRLEIPEQRDGEADS